MFKRFFSSRTEKMLSELPPVSKRPFEDDAETPYETRSEWKRYKTSPTTFQRIRVPSSSSMQTTGQSMLLSLRSPTESDPLRIQGPLGKLPSDAYPLQDVLTTHLLCRLHTQMVEHQSTMMSQSAALIASMIPSAPLAVASGNVITLVILMALDLFGGMDVSEEITGEIQDKAVLLSGGFFTLVIRHGILKFARSSDPETRKYDVCRYAWKMLCKTENMKVMSGELEERYYAFVSDHYGVDLKSYLQKFRQLFIGEFPYRRLLNSRGELLDVYRKHPQSAHGITTYFLFCYEAFAKSFSTKTRTRFLIVNFFADIILELARMETNESFRNAVVSVYTTILAQNEKSSTFRALLLLLKRIYSRAEEEKTEDPSSFLLYYLELVWQDVEVTVKKRLDEFCEKFPDVCVWTVPPGEF